MSSDFIISIATNGIVSRVVFFFREGGVMYEIKTLSAKQTVFIFPINTHPHVDLVYNFNTGLTRITYIHLFIYSSFQRGK